MSWAVGFNNRWQRNIGYGVPSYCDHPGCYEEIDRGLAYMCGGVDWDENGCGLVFCYNHLFYGNKPDQVCERCLSNKPPFTPSLDTEEWIEHKETDESWAAWRAERDAKEKHEQHTQGKRSSH